MIESRVVKANIYPSGGILKLRGKAQIVQGQQTLLISGLSKYSDSSTVRLALPASIRVNDVQVVYFDNEEKEVQLKDLKKKIAELERNLEIRNNQVEMWKANADFSGKQTSSVNDVIDYIEKLPERLEKLQSDIEDLSDKLAEEKKQLKKKTAELSLPLVQAAVISDREAEVPFEITVSDSGISWQPFYEIHSNEAAENISLRLRGRIMQGGYERLENVEIVLLSGNIANGGTIPQLHTQYVGLYQRDMYRKTMATGMAFSAPMNAMMVADEDAVAEEAEEEMDTFSNYTATVSQNDTMMEYALAGTWSLQQNSEVICDIEEKKIAGRYHIVSIPKIDDSAYLAYEVSTADIEEILQSEAIVYHNDTYLGKVYINADSTKEKYDISLGRDELVKVKRTQKRKYTSQLLLKGQNRTEYEYEIKAVNNKNKACEVTVIDQIPVSTEKTVIVESRELSGGELKKNTGEVRWNFTLEPSASRTIALNYDVSWPKDKKINL